MTTTTTDKKNEHDDDDDVVGMQAAIRQSQVAVDAGCMPFGAVLMDDATPGKILLEAHNGIQVVASSGNSQRGGGVGASCSSVGKDVTKHAEMELIRKMAQLDLKEDDKTSSSLTIYASTEPCVMCAGCIYWSGVSRVVYGCSSASLEKISGPGGFDVPIEKLYSMGRPGMRKMKIVGPLLSAQALQVHQDSGVWSSSSLATKTASSTKDTEDRSSSSNNKDIETERSLFASGLGAAPASTESTVPVIDLSSGTDEEIAQQLWEAAHTIGFFTVIGHGIPQELIDQAFQASADFFAQPQDAKESQSPFAKHLNSGYEYYSQVRPSTGTTDQKESLQITARQGAMDGRWPTKPKDFHDVSNQLLQQAHKLASRILDLLEPKACPMNKVPGTLAQSHKLWSHDGQSTLRMLHYPPISRETLQELVTPDANGRIHWRAGPHTDWCNITLLFQRPGQAGLECCSNPHSTSGCSSTTWTPVNPVPGGIAVNIGDMLARWSRGRLYSNLHRVRMPTPQECGKSRYSIAYFAQSDKSTLIPGDDDDGDGDHGDKTSGTPSITAGDYILSRIQSNFAKDAVSSASSS